MKPPKIPLLGRVVIAIVPGIILGGLCRWGFPDLCHLQRFVRQLPVVYHSADYSRVGLMITVYIAVDSFGTAGDGAIALIMDKWAGTSRT